MKTQQSERRPTIKEILDGEDLKSGLKKTGKTDKDIAGILAPLVGGLSKEAFYVSMKAGQALGQTLNLASKKNVERTFSARYGSVALSVILAIKNSGREIVQVMDVPKGAFVEAKMGSDMFSLGGTLMFDILDNGPNNVSVLGVSEIKGQMFGWGKGARALNDILDKATQYLRRLE